jgi:hypothetical protein
MSCFNKLYKFQKYDNTNNSAKHQELLKIRESIEELRSKLNKMAGEGERLILSEEIIKTSQQLDMLIRDYYKKA